MPNCSSLQKSLAWCQGTPEFPGIKRRLYYTSKANIAKWPTLPTDAAGRPTGAVYQGSFVLVADANWKYIDILSDKSQLTSEAQGEVPSQTQLNKLTAVHPAVGPDATAASAYLNNSDNVFIIEDMKGKYRVVGSDMWNTKTTVSQDLGQGATGTTSTTINVEATDVVPAPFYEGSIVTEDGTIEASGSSSGSSGSSGSTNTGSGSSNTGSGSQTTSYKLLLNASPSVGGSVTGAGQYAKGAQATIKATAKSGYTFTRWSDGSTNAQRTLIISGDLTLIAYFVTEGSDSGSSGGNASDEGVD